MEILESQPENLDIKCQIAINNFNLKNYFEAEEIFLQLIQG